jgi:hypothetical protein
MQTVETWERACWSVLFCGIAIAGYLITRPNEEHLKSPALIPSVVLWNAEVDSAALARALDVVVTRDPFRIARRPSPVAFGAEPTTPVPQIPPQPRPTLTLSGIVGGPPWTAVIEGIPGRETPIVVQRGDSIAGVVVRRVERDHVVVAAMDTVWKLTLKRVWR